MAGAEPDRKDGSFDVPDLIRSRIRDVPDYPSPGILFKDITPLLADHIAFAHTVDAIVTFHGRGTINKVVGVEARGFIIAAPVAYHFGAGFVPVRKKGKLPSATYEESYELEYAAATLEVHQDAFTPGDRVVIVDDVLATGGTALASAALIERAGGVLVGVSVVIELEFLHGRQRLVDAGLPVHSLVSY